MRLTRLPGAPAPVAPPEVVLTVGNFDGLHLGHRALIALVRQRAAARGLATAVVTFEPHPRLVLRRDAALHLLSSQEEKTLLFREAGVDHLVVWRFDTLLQAMDAETFLRALSRYVVVRHLVHGPGFALGHRRHGTHAVLAEIGARLGFTVEAVDPQQWTGAADLARGRTLVASSAIREQIALGEVESAAAGLGRPPALAGTVVHGEKMGRTLGYPTANLEVDPLLAVPADGVYAAWAELHPFTDAAERLPAAVSIGTRPQFGGMRRVIEAYLLDFSGDLYGQQMRLHFVSRLRGQQRFESVESLVVQIGRDVDAVRTRLSRAAAGRHAAGGASGPGGTGGKAGQPAAGAAEPSVSPGRAGR